MKHVLGIGIAMLATASLALAGGKDEGDKKKKKGGEKPPMAKTPPVVEDGWSGGPGDGITYTSDKFRLTLGGTVQVQLGYADNNAVPNSAGTASRVDDSLSFDVRRTRTWLKGYVYDKHITFKLQNEWQDSESVKDAWLDWHFYDTDHYDMSIRVGQMKSRFGRDWNTSHRNLEFVDRSLTTRTFAGTRVRGATLHGTAQSGKLGWSVGVQNSEMAGAAANSGRNGDPRASALRPIDDDRDNELNWNLELHWTSNPAKINLSSAQGDLGGDNSGGWGLGAAWYQGNGRHDATPAPFPTATISDTETGSLNIWSECRSGTGIALSGEYFLRMEESDAAGIGDADSDGFQVAASWTAAKIPDQTQWGAALRYSFIRSDDIQILLTDGLLAGQSNNEAQEVEIGVNMYSHGHKLKNQLSLRWQNIDVPGAILNEIDNYFLVFQTTFVF